MTCPEGARIEACCSNGGACGGAAAEPRFDRFLLEVLLSGPPDVACSAFEIGFTQVECEGTVGGTNGALECWYFEDEFPR